MSDTLSKPTRRSRFATDPIKNAQGQPIARPPHALSEIDLSIISALALDRFLSAKYLAALIGKSYDTIIDRLYILRNEPHRYVKICDEQADPANRRFYLHTSLYFELTDLGIRTAADRLKIDLPPRTRIGTILAHQILADQVMASLRIGVKASDGRFAMLTRDELLAHRSMPESTRTSTTPDHIPLGDKIKSEKGGKDVPHTIRPDREMFVIRDIERNKAFFFPGIEIGTGSEQHRASRHDHSFTESKFEDYIAISEKEIYRSHFGAPNFFIAFIEPNPRRIANMMALLEEMTKHKPSLRKSFLFKSEPLFTDIEKPRPDGHMLTEDYLRVGYEPFNFLTS